MKKEVFLQTAKTFKEIEGQAWDIYKFLWKIRYPNVEYMESIDNISFSLADEVVFVEGYDGDSSACTMIPFRFFYEENWIKEVKKEMEEKAKEQAKRKAEVEANLKLMMEQKEWKEYLRLKEKFETNATQKTE